MATIVSPDSQSTSSLRATIRARFVPVLISCYLFIALVILAATVVLGYQWYRTPYIGALVEHTLLVNGIQPVQAGVWNAKEAGINFGDQLVAIDGHEFSDVHDYLQVLGTHQVGDQVNLTVITPEGKSITTAITLQKFPRADLLTQFVVPWLIGAVYLGSGLWVFSLRYRDASGQIFAIFAASVTIALAALFDSYSTNRFILLWTISLAISAGALYHLAYVFPERTSRISRLPFLPWLGYVVALILIGVTLPTLYDTANPTAYLGRWQLAYIYLGLSALFFVGLAVFRRFKARLPLVRQQGRIILYGALVSFIPLTIWFIVSAARSDIIFTPYLIIPLAIFPLAVAYAILRYRLLNTDYVLSRVVMYALLTSLTVGGYALIVSGLNLIFHSVLKPTNPFLIGGMVFILAITLSPLRSYLQWLVDTVFFRGQQVYQDRLRIFSQDLNPALELNEIGSLLRKHVDVTLAPSQMHIFLPDPLSEYFVSLADDTGEPTTDLRFAHSSPLPNMLARNNTFIFIGSGMELPPSLQAEKTRIALLGAQVFIPLVGREQQLIGFMALSPRKSGEPYTDLDLDFLSSLSDQAAITVERAQIVTDFERRVNEMNVLMRVAEGINITPKFDDVLELIYAQTNRLIPLKDFWILLYDSDRDLYRYAFYLENDIRLLEYENRPVEHDSGLSHEVIRTQRPIVTDDYDRECQNRNVTPLVEGLFAWIGVPLYAGAETIGALSLASRNPSVVFSAEQLNMLQAIADQAAGAIVKTRLLQETEVRARQLSLINEIGRNLTSTLDLSTLLNQVLDNAVDIINCEAGTLFLVDEETGELIFEVVTGPVADELVGQRLAPGTGHVGQAVNTGKADIVNQVYKTSEWARKPDERTGFQTRDLLLVPMVVKDRVIGVIEVINRRDGYPFTLDDQELLTAFASQAGIALENARLYTLTDQQLAARVDELSVMQRIDRELNASLDTQRAMRITLDWAMNQSGADAGLVGSVDDGSLQIMVDQGYDQELVPFLDRELPLDSFAALRSAVSNADTQIIQRDQLTDGKRQISGLLEGMKSQLVYPIRREDQVIGVLLLESLRDEPWAEDMQGFLSRLSDHAAIAIANAQLFTQVQAANDAKSDFISFVAHELKTPMTSIRGYTDLLMSGAMGEISEGQENFLQTIRSNVGRMATLVSDLTDISRIEAERLRLDFEAVDISGVVEEVARAQGHGIDQKNQTLEIQVPKDLPAVWGDRVRLVQVLVNLVSNANKYSPEGGEIVITADHTSNQWDADGAAEVVRVAIKDNGIGMSPEDQEKIFSKFFRSDDPKARQAPGSGLGLNISKNLVEMQGGMIWFESEYEKGTTFYITIPVAQV